jgi:hypothetical protein
MLSACAGETASSEEASGSATHASDQAGTGSLVARCTVSSITAYATLAPALKAKVGPELGEEAIAREICEQAEFEGIIEEDGRVADMDRFRLLCLVGALRGYEARAVAAGEPGKLSSIELRKLSDAACRRITPILLREGPRAVKEQGEEILREVIADLRANGEISH